jgi:hypothetical protein
MDWLGVVSNGAYPTAGSSTTKRAIQAVSYGLLVLAATIGVGGGGGGGLWGMGMDMSMGM